MTTKTAYVASHDNATHLEKNLSSSFPTSESIILIASLRLEIFQLHICVGHFIGSTTTKILIQIRLVMCFVVVVFLLLFFVCVCFFFVFFFWGGGGEFNPFLFYYQICNFPDISYLSEMQKNTFQFLNYCSL